MSAAIQAILVSYQGNLDYARRLIADLPEEKMTHQPAPGMNHPAWVLGHLAYVADVAGVQLGLASMAPSNWPALFGGKSIPLPEISAYPDKATLLRLLEENHARVAGVLSRASGELLEQPPADENRRKRWPTMAQLLVHMCVNHEAMHLGQVSAWRRVQGLPPV